MCVAVAVLVACYGPCDEGSGYLPRWQQQQGPLQPQPPHGCPLEQVTKHTVRQRLAAVSSAYPQARPTRGNLKQVFNYFSGTMREHHKE